MAEHRSTPEYAQAFQTFLNHTDEKAVLRTAIEKKLASLNPQSLLDIGAGNGDLSIPLSKRVSRYVAVEQNPLYTQRLRKAGIEVFEGVYPFTIVEKFEAVLISHALPSYSRGLEGWQPFIEAAWGQLTTRGHLLLVSFEDEDSEWNDLVVGSNLEALSPRVQRLAQIESWLQSVGRIKKEIVTTHVRTDMLDEMMLALGFVWSDGIPDKMELFLSNKTIRQVLLNKYRAEGGFSFPFLHYVLDTSV